MFNIHYRVVQAASIFVNVLIASAITICKPIVVIPYHTSILTGQGWVLELMDGHSKRMHTELGVRVHVFCCLVATLQKARMASSKHLSLEEKLAIFLYASVTGLSIQHLGERFQHSNETISK